VVPGGDLPPSLVPSGAESAHHKALAAMRSGHLSEAGLKMVLRCRPALLTGGVDAAEAPWLMRTPMVQPTSRSLRRWAPVHVALRAAGLSAGSAGSLHGTNQELLDWKSVLDVEL
jgi:hypothetical protein